MIEAKPLDAVAMKRVGSLQVHRAVANLSAEQQLAYWQQRTAALLEQQRRLRLAPHTGLVPCKKDE